MPRLRRPRPPAVTPRDPRRSRAVPARARARSRSRSGPRAAAPSRPRARRPRAAARSTTVTWPSVPFTTLRWFVANAATCARCVTTMTCERSARRASRRPISIAAAPPTPASTSSKTKVGTGSLPAITTSIASITRESSPPEAPRETGRGSAPGMRLEQDRRPGRGRARRARASASTLTREARIGHRERRELGGHRVGEPRRRRRCAAR